MSKQGLIDTLSNRGYRFDLNQFSEDRLLQLLRESDVLYHQVKKDVSVSNRESITAATVRNGKGKKPEQTAQHVNYGTSGTHAQPEINYNLPRSHSMVGAENAVSVARERVRTSQGDSGRQAAADSPLAYRSGQHAQGERQEGADRGKRKSGPDDEQELKSKTEQERKKKMKEKEIGVFALR